MGKKKSAAQIRRMQKRAEARGDQYDYKVDEKGSITKCNLIVSTTHNNEPMNRAVRWVAWRIRRAVGPTPSD